MAGLVGDVTDVPAALSKGREVLPDPTAIPCPEKPRTLTQVKDSLYRHTNGALPALHSDFVLVTSEGAIVIDPAGTYTSTWLRDEIKSRFKIQVCYVIYTHAHFDHIAGGQVFQEDGAIVIAHKNAVEPIIGERLPTAVPDRVFDKDMTIELGGETVKLYRIAPSHSNSMIQVYFPRHKALQCTDTYESDTFPYNDFLDFYYDGWAGSNQAPPAPQPMSKNFLPGAAPARSPAALNTGRHAGSFRSAQSRALAPQSSP